MLHPLFLASRVRARIDGNKMAESSRSPSFLAIFERRKMPCEAILLCVPEFAGFKKL